jgi:hypothetical protein
MTKTAMTTARMTAKVTTTTTAMTTTAPRTQLYSYLKIYTLTDIKII